MTTELGCRRQQRIQYTVIMSSICDDNSTDAGQCHHNRCIPFETHALRKNPLMLNRGLMKWRQHKKDNQLLVSDHLLRIIHHHRLLLFILLPLFSIFTSFVSSFIISIHLLFFHHVLLRLLLLLLHTLFFLLLILIFFLFSFQSLPSLFLILFLHLLPLRSSSPPHLS